MATARRSLPHFLLAGALALFGLASPVSAQQADKANILVIFGDDVGWMNVSSYGGDIMGVQTPNIDRIGREGLRLTSFYAQPSCTAAARRSSPASCRCAPA